jgi:AbrB family looped-hinge helix DNA binding protein
MEATMPAKPHKTMKMKIFPKGQVVIPIELRRKHHLEIGDQLQVISTDEGILLKSSPEKRSKRSLTDQLFGIFKKEAEIKSTLTKKDIQKATETSFTKGWSK